MRELPGVAEVLDPSTVQLTPRGSFTGSPIDIVARVEDLPVAVDQPARMVINEASGTVVMGSDVRISPVAIAQGGLTISVTETPIASQPAPFSQGPDARSAAHSRCEVDDGIGPRARRWWTAAHRSGTLVCGLNALGVSPRGLITILQALKSAGALQADIEVQ